MNSCWISTSEECEIVVRNGEAQPVRIVIARGLHPIIVCEGTHFYPRTWEGVIYHNGTMERWKYPTGPVREIRVRTDNDGTKWALVIWK